MTEEESEGGEGTKVSDLDIPIIVINCSPLLEKRKL